MVWACLVCACVGCSDSDRTPGQPDASAGDGGGVDAAPDAADTGRLCEPGSATCRDEVTRLVCAPGGATQEPVRCADGLRCDPGTGDCLAQVCAPGAFSECTEAGLQRYCNTAGTGFEEDICPNGSSCEGDRCADPECQAGVVRCVDRTELEVCNDAGAFVPRESCPTGTECFNGECLELCEINSKVSSYIGCEYWSADLPNYEDALSQPHAIVVTNPNPDLPAAIKIEVGFSGQELTVGDDGVPFVLEIPPGEAQIYSIPVGFDHSGTRVLQDKALRVTSSIPVIAHQFNPLNNVFVFSNDGTLLVPTNAVGKDYWGLSWPFRGGAAQIRGYLTVVNSTGAPNRVRVTPRARVAAGPGIPPIEPGETREFDLGPGDSLNLMTDGAEFDEAQQSGCLVASEGPPVSVDPCPDLTGTRIEADQPVTMFGGHQCGNVLLGIDRCDHMESILFPTDSWGTSYVATKFRPRAPGALSEPDIWRVVAAADDTLIQTVPPIDGIHNTRLAAGEWRQFESRQVFELSASGPVMMAQYMVGANWLGIPRECDEGMNAGSPVGIGDPAMAVTVPVDQYRDDYFVLAPADYRFDYLNIVAPTGVAVELDGAPIDASLFTERSGGWSTATVEVADGFHRLRAEQPFGVVSYGYDCRVSYAFPGGLNLETLRDLGP